MFNLESNYLDKTTLFECINMYKNSETYVYRNDGFENDLPSVNIVGVGQLGKYFIDYCSYQDRWNNDNSMFTNSIENISKKSFLNKLSEKLSFLTLDQLMISHNGNTDVNIFLYNLSELGEFDKFINKAIEVKSVHNIIFGVKTKHSRLQFDIIINKLRKDTKIPIVLVDEEKLLNETNNYIVYELYNLARNFIEN